MRPSRVKLPLMEKVIVHLNMLSALVKGVSRYYLHLTSKKSRRPKSGTKISKSNS